MNSDSRTDLSNVTICAVDSLNPRLASRALEISSRHCKFGDVVLFTHEEVDTEARIVTTPHIASREQYNDFILKNVIRHIHTPWVLLVQWDGYVVDPSAWSADFLDYDYIGARWPSYNDGMSVGNGGFSLRSAKLMHLLASDEFPLRDGINEDELIGRIYRPVLEAQHGIKFSPNEVADRFSYENAAPSGPTFGFHSPHNFFQHLTDLELRELVDMAHPGTVATDSMICLLANYLVRNRLVPVRILYSGMMQTVDADHVRETLLKVGMSADLAEYCVSRCEALIREPAP